MNRVRSRGRRWPSRLLGATAAVAGLLCIGAGAAEAGWTNIGPYPLEGLVNPLDALAIDPTTPTTLYAGGDGGVFKSTDGGVSWRRMYTGLTCKGRTCLVKAFALDPQTPTTLYAGGVSPPGPFPLGGLFKSTDGGMSWSELNMDAGIVLLQALALDPQTPTTLYAGTVSGICIGPGYCPGGGLSKSTDGGTSWSGVFGADIMALALDPMTPTTLYAATWGYGIFKSTDGGGSWSGVNTGLTSSDVRALAIDPTTPTTLYAGGDGVFKSTDAGTSWHPMNTGLDCGDITCPVVAFAIDPTTPTTLYAGTFDGGVFKSTDAGTSWHPMNTGLTCGGPTCTVYALALDPVTPTILYAGTGWGVFKWTCCTLTVERAGAGEGTVTSNPPGIECGSDCAEHYAAGTSVALTATPSAGSRFTDWSGDCTGSGACVVSMAEDRSVSATFTLSPPSGGGGDGSGCFIATAAYGSPLAPEVARLREFRDRYLLPHRSGQAVVGLYARLSPGVAHTVARSAAARAVVRVGLIPLCWWAGFMLAAPGAGMAVALCALGLVAWLGLVVTRTFRRSLRR